MNGEKDRIVWIDQLRGIAFFFVILGHVALPKEMQSLIYSFHMPLFFLISGLTVNRNKLISMPIKNYIIRQVKGLIVPYLWMSFFCFPLWYFAFHILSQSTDVTIWGAFKGIFAGNNMIISSTSNALWFLLVLFFANILYVCLLKLTKGNEAVLLCAVLICGVTGYLDKGVAQPWHFNVALTAVTMLYIGNRFMMWYKQSSFRDYKISFAYIIKMLALIIAFTAIGLVSHRFNGRISMTANKFGNSLLLFYITALAFSAAITLIVMHLPKIKFITYIGQNTLLYIGIHIPILRIFEKAYPDIFLQYKFSIPFAFVLYIGLIPVVMFFKKFFPYFCGKTCEGSVWYQNILKVIMVAWCALMPYAYVINFFGLMSYDLISLYLLILISLSIVFVIITNKYVPVIYLEDRKNNVINSPAKNL